MARRFFALVALMSMALAAAAPMALAHGGQEGVVGPQPVEWMGEEVTVSGLLEPGIEKMDGTPTWQMEDETSGGFYHVEEGDSVELAAFEGQRVSLHGALGQLEGAVILADSVEPLEGETADAAQYDPEGKTGEEIAATGVVEYLDDKADGTPVYGLAVSPEEGHYMEGDFAFAAFEDEQVNVTGRFVYYQGGFRYLRVESIEPVGDEVIEDVQAVEENESVPAESPEVTEAVEEVTPAVTPGTASSAVPAVAPQTVEIEDEATEATIAVELASEETPLVVEAADNTDEPGVFSAAAKALPITGGMALLLPLAGLVLAAAGLTAFRITQ